MNINEYRHPEDVTDVLCKLAGSASESDQKLCLNAVYDLHAMAENPHNADKWRILYQVLSDVAEKNEN